MSAQQRKDAIADRLAAAAAEEQSSKVRKAVATELAVLVQLLYAKVEAKDSIGAERSAGAINSLLVVAHGVEWIDRSHFQLIVISLFSLLHANGLSQDRIREEYDLLNSRIADAGLRVAP